MAGKLTFEFGLLFLKTLKRERKRVSLRLAVNSLYALDYVARLVGSPIAARPHFFMEFDLPPSPNSRRAVVSHKCLPRKSVVRLTDMTIAVTKKQKPFVCWVNFHTFVSSADYFQN